MGKFKKLFEQILNENWISSFNIYKEDLPKFKKLIDDIYNKNKDKDFVVIDYLDEFLGNYYLYFYKDNLLWCWYLSREKYTNIKDFKNREYYNEKDYLAGAIDAKYGFKQAFESFKKEIMSRLNIVECILNESKDKDFEEKIYNFFRENNLDIFNEFSKWVGKNKSTIKRILDNISYESFVGEGYDGILPILYSFLLEKYSIKNGEHMLFQAAKKAGITNPVTIIHDIGYQLDRILSKL